MIEIIEGLPEGLFGLEIRGVVEEQDTDEAMVAFSRAVRQRYNVGLLLDFIPGASIPEASTEALFYMRMRFRGPVKKCAIVATHDWQPRFVDFLDFLGCEGRQFSAGDRDKAVEWLVSAAGDGPS